MLLVALLTVRRDALASFRAYESAAARIMARHGGGIERAIVLEEDASSATVRELHIVRFPDAGAFASYRADPALAELAALRESSVISTELWRGVAEPSYP